jgi:ribonuclease BN (tRNA processing enzyme)
MKIEFLGTAGYHPSAHRHTSCSYVSSISDASQCGILLDAGTGMYRLIGRALPKTLNIFLSHAHLDHTSGLTYLLNVLWGTDTKVVLYADERTLDVVKNDLFDSPLFPLPFDHPTVTVEPGKTYQVCGAQVSAFLLTHPGGSLAYRFDWPGKSLAYVTDTAGDGRYIDFVRGVDLLVHERNFSDSLHEIAAASGHCTSEQVLRVVREAGVKNIALTHFNPLTKHEPLEEDSLLSTLLDLCPHAISARDELIVEF